MKWKKGRKRPMNEQQKTPKQPEEDMTFATKSLATL